MVLKPHLAAKMDEKIAARILEITVRNAKNITNLAKAYKEQALKFHPDKAAGDPQKQAKNDEIMKRINKARDFLLEKYHLDPDTNSNQNDEGESEGESENENEGEFEDNDDLGLGGRKGNLQIVPDIIIFDGEVAENARV